MTTVSNTGISRVARLLGAALFALVALPAPAWAAIEPVAVAAVGAAVIAAFAVAVALLTWRRFEIVDRARRNAEAAKVSLESVFNTAPAAVYLWRLDGEEYASPNLFRVLGVPGNGKDRFQAVLESFVPPDRARLRQAVSRLRDDGLEFELLLTSADGERRLSVAGRRVVDDRRRVTADGAWFRDVTSLVGEIDRLAREREALAAERACLDAVLEAAEIPIWCRDDSLRLIDGNRPFLRAVEAETVETAVAESREIAAGAIADGGRALAAEALARGEPRRETHHLVMGGDRRLVEITEIPLAECGKVVGFAIDRTEINELRAELRRHVEAHADMLEHLGSAIAIFGPDRRIKFFNTSYARLWQFDEEWLRGEPEYGDILEALRERRRLPEQPDFPAYKREQLDRFTNLVESYEELLHLPDGSTLRSVTAPHPFGGLLMTFEDVTDRLALERSYNTLIEVQRETLDKLYEGIVVFGGDLRLKLSNPAFARIWDVPDQMLESEPHASEMVEHMRGFFQDEAVWAGLKREIFDDITERSERSGRFERADGSVIDWAKVPLPDGAVMLRFIDITDSVRVERALRERAEALEAADRLKSEFVANVSYELRNPLNAIIGFAELLVGGYSGSLNEKQADYCESILSSSRQLLSLINDILDLATIEAGRITLQRETVLVRNLLHATADLCQEWARDQELTLEVDCPADSATLVADERRLKQVLFNLVSNAIKFSPPGGRIVLSARQDGAELELAVSDTGPGIAEDERERMFESFVTGGPGRAREAGAGLGLSLVKSFVELHGGRVEIGANEGGGTVVRCFLPVDGAEADASAQAASPPPA